jgi:hypothetical protein
MNELTHEQRLQVPQKLWDAYRLGYEGQPLNLVHFQTWSQDQHDCYQMGRTK